MKLKVDGEGHAILEDGKPVYIHDDGKEVPFDAPATVLKIASLNREAQTHREAKEAAEAKLKTYEGIDDPEDAKKALETVKNIKDGELIAAGQVEQIKRGAAEAAQKQIDDAQKAWAREKEKLEGTIAKKDADLNKHLIGGAFQRSKLITDPKHPKALVIPPDIAESAFGKNFKVEDGGKVIGYYADGTQIFSRARPGEIADFDEALEELVERYSFKDQILRGTGSRGDGARQGQGGGVGVTGEKRISRVEFDKLPPLTQAAKVKEGVKIVDTASA